MKDKSLTCQNCKNLFVWSSQEQEIYKQRALPTPEYCPICRGIMEARKKDIARSKYER